MTYSHVSIIMKHWWPNSSSETKTTSVVEATTSIAATASSSAGEMNPSPESPHAMPLGSTSNSSTPNENDQAFSTAPTTTTTTTTPLEGKISDERLRELLKAQLEYYFSRENLARDTYLLSQMDSNQYVPIVTIAGFEQVKKLTRNLDLIVDVLRSKYYSVHFQKTCRFIYKLSHSSVIQVNQFFVASKVGYMGPIDIRSLEVEVDMMCASFLLYSTPPFSG